MKTIKCSFFSEGKNINLTAIITDDLTGLSQSKQNQATDLINDFIQKEEQVYRAELEERQRLGLHGDAAIKHYNEWMKKYGMEHLMVKEG